MFCNNHFYCSLLRLFAVLFLHPNLRPHSHAPLRIIEIICTTAHTPSRYYTLCASASSRPPPCNNFWPLRQRQIPPRLTFLDDLMPGWENTLSSTLLHLSVARAPLVLHIKCDINYAKFMRDIKRTKIKPLWCWQRKRQAHTLELKNQ